MEILVLHGLNLSRAGQ